MITNTIVRWFQGFIETIFGLLPGLTPELQAAADALPGQIQTVIDSVSKLGPIVPFSQIELGLRVYFSGLMLSVGIVVVSKVISALTGGGGT